MSRPVNYDRPIEVAEGVYWVGFRDAASNLTCNPYLVVEGEQAVLIDSGSRTDFAAVMMKILQVGIDPRQVVALIYQHYDPDLCGSMTNFIDMCENPGLRVISEKRNNVFIAFYIHRDKRRMLDSIDARNFRFSFNQRTLEFIRTPYSHSPGSFVTYDPKTKTLFSSDLFGSHATQWDLFLSFEEHCFSCADYESCPRGRSECPIREILSFHQEIIPCTKALRHALSKIGPLGFERIAPQHGSVLENRKTADFLMEKLKALENVGIDALI